MSSQVEERHAPDRGTRRKGQLRLASFLVVMATIVLVSYLLASSWDSAREGLANASIAFIAMGWILATLSTLVVFLAFARLFREIHKQSLALSSLGHFFFTAQMMKHLPGRVWGVAYQGLMTRGRVPLADWISVNLGHLALSTYFAGLSAAVIYTYRMGALYAFVCLSGGLVLLNLMWRPSSGRILLALVAHASEALKERIASAVRSSASVPPASKRKIVALFLAGWIMYFCAWALYGAAYPGLGAAEGVYLSASYTVAWIVGYVSLITPSGIGVRELAFAALAINYPPDVVLYGMLIGRAGLLATDLVLGVVFWPFHDEARR